MSTLKVGKLIATNRVKIPVMTESTRDSLTLPLGAVIYNSTTGLTEIFNGDDWMEFGESGGGSGGGAYPFKDGVVFEAIVAAGSVTGPTFTQITTDLTSRGYDWASTYVTNGPYQGYFYWQPPADRDYRIVVEGAQGGGGAGRTTYSGIGINTNGGIGAKVEGTFRLSAADKLCIVVGVGGAFSGGYHGNELGGGGGSFVFKVGSGNTYDVSVNGVTMYPLIIAGGGGGSFSSSYGTSCGGTYRQQQYGNGEANTSWQGGRGSGAFCYSGIGAANFGNGASATGSYYGGGGGGYLNYGSGGSPGHCQGRPGGEPFRYGCRGSQGSNPTGCYGYPSGGGFGGGGSGNLGQSGGGGGGAGGTSIGAWSSYSGMGGGGGSYNSGTEQVNTPGGATNTYTPANGKVTITYA